VVRQAQQLNHPCLVREEPAHEGALGPRASLAEINRDNVILEVIKRHEDSEGFILRAYETHGRKPRATLTFGDVAKRLDFGPCEIKTLLVSEGKLIEVDMLERPPSEDA